MEKKIANDSATMLLIVGVNKQDIKEYQKKMNKTRRIKEIAFKSKN